MSLPLWARPEACTPDASLRGLPHRRGAAREEPSPPLILTFLRVAVTGLVGGCSSSRHDTRVVS